MSQEKITSTRYTITEPQLDEVSVIAGIHAKTWNETYRNDEVGVTDEWLRERTGRRLTPEGLGRYKSLIEEALGDPDHHYYRVAHDTSGEVVGMMHAQLRDGVYELHMLYVLTEYQGKGVAQALMGGFYDWVEPDIPITLEVADYNNRAIKFYEKMGFQIIPDSAGLFAEKIPTIKMKREAKE